MYCIVYKFNVRHVLNGRRSRQFQFLDCVHSLKCSLRHILLKCKIAYFYHHLNYFFTNRLDYSYNMFMCNSCCTLWFWKPVIHTLCLFLIIVQCLSSLGHCNPHIKMNCSGILTVECLLLKTVTNVYDVSLCIINNLSQSPINTEHDKTLDISVLDNMLCVKLIFDSVRCTIVPDVRSFKVANVSQS